MPFQTTKHKGLIFDSGANALLAGNGIHCYAGLQYYKANLPTGANGTLVEWDIGQSIGIYSSNDAGTQFTELSADPNNLTIIANNATLSNVTVWGSDSILTQGRGDGRYATPANLTVYQTIANNTWANLSGAPNISLYQTIANNTWANLTGKPTFATVATSGAYADLSGTPNLSLYLTTANAATTYLPSANFTYANIGGTIPTATNTTLGAIKVGSNLTIANGVLSANGYTLPAATNSTLGGIIVGSNLTITGNGTLSATGGGFQSGDTLNGGSY